MAIFREFTGSLGAVAGILFMFDYIREARASMPTG